MATLSELIKELNTLPLGNVYRKTINGKEYYYHQYFLDGKSYSEIISEEKRNELLPLIKRRKVVQSLIKEIKKNDRSLVLSKNANQLTGYVMCGNIMVAEFDKGNPIYIDESLAPLVIVKTHSLEKFLSLRVIDMSRTNARLLKKALNIDADEEYKIPLYSYALSISDNYWFKPKHSKLKYQNIKVSSDIYSDTALKGDLTVFPHHSKLTPEITTTGSFEKGWKLIDNAWYLFKSGNDKQIFSELFCYRFAKLINIATAEYEYDGKYIRSKNFADKYNFEPIASIADDNDKYEHVFDIIYKLNKDFAKDYLKIIFFDSVVNNVDRHNENLGLLRDRKTGKIVSLAPNFDNNLALISSVDVLNHPKKDKFMDIFIKFIEGNEIAKSLFKELTFPIISTRDINLIIKDIPIDVEHKEDLPNKILARYNYLKEKF